LGAAAILILTGFVISPPPSSTAADQETIDTAGEYYYDGRIGQGFQYLEFISSFQAPDGSFYIAGDHDVYHISSTGTVLKQFSDANQGNLCPVGSTSAVTVSPDFRIVALCSWMDENDGSDNIRTYDPDGTLLKVTTINNPNKGTSGIAVDADGYVWVIRSFNTRVIQKLDSDGNALQSIDTTLKDLPLRSFTVLDDRIYLTAYSPNTVYIYDFNGNSIAQISNPNPSQSHFFRTTTGPSGDIFIIASSSYPPYDFSDVYQFDPSGNLITSSRIKGLSNARSIDYADDTFFIIDSGEYDTSAPPRLLTYTADFKLVSSTDIQLNPNGSLMEPRHVTVDQSTGDVYVIDLRGCDNGEDQCADVVTYSNSGIFLRSFTLQLSDSKNPTGFYYALYFEEAHWHIADNGDIYAINEFYTHDDTTDRRVSYLGAKFAAGSTTPTPFGPPCQDSDSPDTDIECSMPSSMLFADDGVYIVGYFRFYSPDREYTIVKLTDDGSFIPVVPASDDRQIYETILLDSTDDNFLVAGGSIYYLDADGNEHTPLVASVDTAGNITPIFDYHYDTPIPLDDGNALRFWAPSNAAIDANGNIYVAGHGEAYDTDDNYLYSLSGLVLKISPSGELLDLINVSAHKDFGHHGYGSGDFLALDAQANLFILDLEVDPGIHVWRTLNPILRPVTPAPDSRPDTDPDVPRVPDTGTI
jgi:sugar lactone lactonase YvrE